MTWRENVKKHSKTPFTYVLAHIPKKKHPSIDGASAGHPLKYEGTYRISSPHIEPPPPPKKKHIQILRKLN